METSTDQDIVKLKALRKMKASALSLLGFAVLLFIIAIYFKIPILQAFSEAAMVGGIADWFAVVALFKHPLGIPIWHTAIIPTKKNEIGENLGNFVSEEFLNREKLEIKLEEFNFATKASDWLSHEENANKIADAVAVNIIPGVLKTIKKPSAAGTKTAKRSTAVKKDTGIKKTASPAIKKGSRKVSAKK